MSTEMLDEMSQSDGAVSTSSNMFNKADTDTLCLNVRGWLEKQIDATFI